MNIKIHPEFNLLDIYFRDSQASLKDGFYVQSYTGELNGSFRISKCLASVLEDQEIVEVIIGFEFAYLDSPDAPVIDPLVSISADIAVVYTFGESGLPSKEDLDSWTARNSPLHAWPYWREFCHNAQLKLGVPTTIMPLMQPPTTTSSANQKK